MNLKMWIQSINRLWKIKLKLEESRQENLIVVKLISLYTDAIAMGMNLPQKE